MKSPAQRTSTLESARMVTTYLLQEPVKQAVREALHEEGVTDVPIDESDESYASSDSSGSGGPSKLAVGIVLVTLGGVAYLVSQRRQSGGGWSSESESITRQGQQSGRRESGTTGSQRTSSGSSTTTSSDETSA